MGCCRCSDNTPVVAAKQQVFEVAAAEMGKDEIDARVVQAVWERILPGMLEKYDAIHSLPCIAPRPLLILNGEDDRRCPVGSLMPAIEATRKRYHELHAADKFEVYLQTNCGHQATEEMHEATYTFFQRHFMTESSSSAR